MSFQQTSYSTPNFQIIPQNRSFVAPWASVQHIPSSAVLGAVSITLTPEQLVSGTVLVSPEEEASVDYRLPDVASLFRFLSTRSVPGYENISNNDVFIFNVINTGLGTANFLPGTGAIGITHVVYEANTQAYQDVVPIQWTVTSTGSTYTVL